MKKYFLLVVLLSVVWACNDHKTTSEAKPATFPLAKSEYTILPFSEKKYYHFKNAKPATLSNEELILIEKLFQKMKTEYNAGQARALAKHNQEHPENQWEKTGFELETEGYKRQYLPVLNEKGEKEVWINFFCHDFEDDIWKTATFNVADGGNCFYSLKINLVTKEIYHLRINGYA